MAEATKKNETKTNEAQAAAQPKQPAKKTRKYAVKVGTQVKKVTASSAKEAAAKVKGGK